MTRLNAARCTSSTRKSISIELRACLVVPLEFSKAGLRREFTFFNRATRIAALSAAGYVLGSLTLEWIFGLGHTLSAQLAIGMSALISYFGHSLFTFSTRVDDKGQMIRFIGALMLTSLISWLVTAFVIPFFELKYWQGLVIVSGVVPAFNYVILRSVVFRITAL